VSRGLLVSYPQSFHSGRTPVPAEQTALCDRHLKHGERLNHPANTTLRYDGQADETIFLVRRSHPETNQCSIRPLDREESYGRGHRGSGCLVQHQHLRGSCPRRVSDALTGMDRSILPSADPSTVWLADLIEATEVVAASAEPCDPAIVTAFSHRLELRADVRPLFEPAALGTGELENAGLSPI
jgi:hypothetical protein